MDCSPALSPLRRLKEINDLTWKLANCNPADLTSECLSDARLIAVWSGVKNLSVVWTAELTDASRKLTDGDLRNAITGFEQISSELFVADLFYRVLATVLSGQELDLHQERGMPDEERTIRLVLEHALQHLEHARKLVLTELVRFGETCAAVDRMRRRCERWCDLFIGPWIVRYGIASFAHDPRRAWDYGEDALLDLEFPYQRELLYRSYVEAFRSRLVESTWNRADLHHLVLLAMQLLGLPVMIRPGEHQAEPSRLGLEVANPAIPDPDRPVEAQGPSALLERCLRRVPDSTASERKPAADQ